MDELKKITPQPLSLDEICRRQEMLTSTGKKPETTAPRGRVFPGLAALKGKRK